jgi:hypothetical protein
MLRPARQEVCSWPGRNEFHQFLAKFDPEMAGDRLRIWLSCLPPQKIDDLQDRRVWISEILHAANYEEQ